MLFELAITAKLDLLSGLVKIRTELYKRPQMKNYMCIIIVIIIVITIITIAEYLHECNAWSQTHFRR